MPDNPKDKRKHTRIPLTFEAELHIPDKPVIRGTMKNISFSGVFLLASNVTGISIGENCTLKLILEPGADDKAINFNCQIVRADNSGIGIKFINIDISGYQQFKNLMVYNSPDPERLIAELETNPGLDIQP